MDAIALIIVEPGTGSVTIHETLDNASDALRQYLGGKWKARFGVAFPETGLTTEEAARRYFSDGGRNFILGEVSLNDIQNGSN